MRGAVKRREGEIERDIALAHTIAAMNAAAQSKGGLRDLKHYLPKRGSRSGKVQRQDPAEMRSNLLALAARANAVYKKGD